MKENNAFIIAHKNQNKSCMQYVKSNPIYSDITAIVNAQTVHEALKIGHWYQRPCS